MINQAWFSFSLYSLPQVVRIEGSVVVAAGVVVVCTGISNINCISNIYFYFIGVSKCVKGVNLFGTFQRMDQQTTSLFHQTKSGKSLK